MTKRSTQTSPLAEKERFTASPNCISSSVDDVGSVHQPQLHKISASVLSNGRQFSEALEILYIPLRPHIRDQSSVTQMSGPMEVSGGSAPLQGMYYTCKTRNETDPGTEKCKAQFELGVTLSLFFWPSLSLAVVNNWGGPDSKDKREWFASETIDLLDENPDADAGWIEEFLLNGMLDNFEVNVDDESGYEVAEQILRLRRDCAKGDFREVLAMKEKWDRTGGKSEDVGKLFEKKERNEEDDETDGSEDIDDEEDEDMDMDEAPPLVKVKEPVVPEVDEDGFTKVTKKRR